VKRQLIERCKWKTIRTRVRPRVQWATQCTKRKGKGNVQEAAAVAARLEPRKQRSSNSRKPVIQPGSLAHPMMPSWTQVRAANRLCFLRRVRRLSTTSCRSRWVPWTVGSRERRPHNQCSLPQMTSCLRSSPRRGREHCQVDSKMDSQGELSLVDFESPGIFAWSVTVFAMSPLSAVLCKGCIHSFMSPLRLIIRKCFSATQGSHHILTVSRDLCL